MHRTSLIVLSLIALVGLSLPAIGSAKPGKRAKAAKPQITRVAPMRVNVGDRLVIQGKNFKAKKRRNTVIFRGSGGRTAFAKPRSATRKRLVVKIPASVARLLVVKDGKQRPTRLKLRVLAGKFSRFTPRRLSPVVLGAGAGKSPGKPLTVCNSSSDHDNDMLSNEDELKFKTDPCLADTDGDGLTDGWEFYSARDLNLKAVPYPHKRPFPNPLDPDDANVDFDGDGLLASEEFRVWRYTGSSFIAANVEGAGPDSPLGYSDGTKFSRGGDEPSEPYSYDDNPAWSDDERDADADGLSNWIESARGPGKPSWWTQFWAQEKFASFGIKPWPAPLMTCGDQRPGPYNERPFAELDLADPDVDGDRLLDGEDDQDNDGYSNLAEMVEVARGATGVACGIPDVPVEERGGEPWIVNAFNPCAPDPQSRTCPRHYSF